LSLFGQFGLIKKFLYQTANTCRNIAMRRLIKGRPKNNNNKNKAKCRPCGTHMCTCRLKKSYLVLDTFLCPQFVHIIFETDFSRHFTVAMFPDPLAPSFGKGAMLEGQFHHFHPENKEGSLNNKCAHLNCLRGLKYYEKS
jgi:hypothetical protein